MEEKAVNLNRGNIITTFGVVVAEIIIYAGILCIHIYTTWIKKR